MGKRTTSRLPTAQTIGPDITVADYRTYHRSWYGSPGEYDHDLLCSDPSCDEVMLIGWTFDAAQHEFSTRQPAVGRCPKGHLSHLPTNVAHADPGKEE